MNSIAKGLDPNVTLGWSWMIFQGLWLTWMNEQTRGLGTLLRAHLQTPDRLWRQTTCTDAHRPRLRLFAPLECHYHSFPLQYHDPPNIAPGRSLHQQPFFHIRQFCQTLRSVSVLWYGICTLRICRYLSFTRKWSLKIASLQHDRFHLHTIWSFFKTHAKLWFHTQHQRTQTLWLSAIELATCQQTTLDFYRTLSILSESTR